MLVKVRQSTRRGEKREEKLGITAGKAMGRLKEPWRGILFTRGSEKQW